MCRFHRDDIMGSEEIPWQIFVVLAALVLLGVIIYILLNLQPAPLGGWLGGLENLLKGK